MRKSFYTLSGVVKDLMGQDVRNGDVFIFIGRTCSSMKILHMECGGLVIYHLRLEEGQFKLPAFDEEIHTYKTTWQNLMLMVQGIDMGNCTRCNMQIYIRRFLEKLNQQFYSCLSNTRPVY